MLSEEEKLKIKNMSSINRQAEMLTLCDEILIILENIKQERHGKNNRNSTQITSN